MNRQRGSWVALIIFCATAVFVAAVGFAILLTGATLAYAVGQSLRASDQQQQQPAAVVQEESFSGLITDSRCGARHARNSGKSPAECAHACVRRGASYILVDGDRSYHLNGNQAELDKYAGQRVRIGGSLNGDTIQTSSIDSDVAPNR